MSVLAPERARVLPDRAQTLLGDLPPYLRDDPMTQAVIVASGNEWQRIEDAATALLESLIPGQAQDVAILGRYTAPLLSMWEKLLGLPVNPAGATLSDRQAKVRARIQTRNSGAGSEWVEVLTEALVGVAWTYQEGPGSYQVTITLPTRSGTYSAGQVSALARQITPAHLDLVVGYTGGFLVGVSNVGTDPL